MLALSATDTATILNTVSAVYAASITAVTAQLDAITA